MAKLIGRTGPAAGQDFVVADSARLGASAENDVRIAANGVSRRHARVWREGNNFFVEDFGATNGTFLNGDRIQRETLRHLDVITLGREVDLIFLSRENEPVATVVDSVLEVKLEFVDGPEAGTTIDVPKGEITFGRAPACNVVLASQAISKVHARLQRTGSQIVLQDLQSANSTFVNGRKVETVVPLSNGDMISFAGVRGVSVSIKGKTEGAGGAVAPAAAAQPAFDQEWKTRFVWAPEDLAAIENARAEAIALASLRAPAPAADKKPAPAKAAPAKAVVAAAVKPPAPAAKPAAPVAGPAVTPPAPVAQPPAPAAVAAPPPPKPPAPAAPAPPAPAPIAAAPPKPVAPPVVPVAPAPPAPAPMAAAPPPKPVPPPAPVAPRPAPVAAAPPPAPVVAPPPPAPVTVAPRPAPVAAVPPAPPKPAVRSVPADGPTIAAADLDAMTVQTSIRISGLRLIGGASPISLGLGTFLIGRGSTANVRIEDPQASRSHASIVVAPTGVTVEDLQTVNGTRLNGVEVKAPVVVKTGDVIKFGGTEFKIEVVTS